MNFMMPGREIDGAVGIFMTKTASKGGVVYSHGRDIKKPKR